jgi:hypothetical protein
MKDDLVSLVRAVIGGSTPDSSRMSVDFPRRSVPVRSNRRSM